MALITNEEYFNNLSESGLELAEECLLDDLAILQENDLSTNETVTNLLLVHSRLSRMQAEEQDEDDP